jgi:hypothetical protein
MPTGRNGSILRFIALKRGIDEGDLGREKKRK